MQGSAAGEGNGNGTLAKLTFEVIAVKASTVKLFSVILTDSAGEETRPPVEDAQITVPAVNADVNEDGSVDNTDAALVAEAMGTDNAKYDTTGDGTVDFLDLFFVLENRDDDAAGAPTSVGLRLTPVQRDRIQEQIELLIAMGDRSPAMPADVGISPATSRHGNPSRANAVACELSEPVQSRDMDTLSVGKRCGRYPTYLCSGWTAGSDVGTWTSACRHISEPAPCRLLGWQECISVNPWRAVVYFYTLTVGEFTATRKMLIRK